MMQEYTDFFGYLMIATDNAHISFNDGLCFYAKKYFDMNKKDSAFIRNTSSLMEAAIKDLFRENYSIPTFCSTHNKQDQMEVIKLASKYAGMWFTN